MVSIVNPVLQSFLIAQVTSGLVLVRSFYELNEYANSMLVLQPSEKQDGTGPVTVRRVWARLQSILTKRQAVRSLIHGSLNKIEAVYSKYTAALPDASSPTDPRIHEVRITENFLLF
jgi:hypothetical protein